MVECPTHGQTTEAYVCHHLIPDSATGLGFNRNPPVSDDPFPDAWCNDCELIRAAHGGWTKEAQKLTDIELVCGGCYEQIRARNTRE